jgi:hypothetical protein
VSKAPSSIHAARCPPPSSISLKYSLRAASTTRCAGKRSPSTTSTTSSSIGRALLAGRWGRAEAGARALRAGLTRDWVCPERVSCEPKKACRAPWCRGHATQTGSTSA